MLALDASFVLTGPEGERVVKADGFFVGLYETQLQPDEILTQIRIPIPAAGSGWSYSKLKRKTGDFATAAAAVHVADEGRARWPRSIALTNVGVHAAEGARGRGLRWSASPLDEASLTRRRGWR